MSTTDMVIRIEVPRALVYRALTEAAAVATWMVPTGMTSHIHEFDAREGGAYRISLTYDAPDRTGKTADQTDTFHGRFVRLVPNELVVQALEFESPDPAMRGEMTITYRLAESGGVTELTAQHANVPPGITPADNQLGWRISLGKLKALLESQDASV